MEMKSWISLSYTQIWFLALDQQAGSTGSEEAGVGPAPTSDLFKKESFLSMPERLLGTCRQWLRGFFVWKLKRKEKKATQRTMKKHSSEGIGANSNPSPWGLRWSHSITCFHLSRHITVTGAEASDMSSYCSMDLSPNGILLQLELSNRKKEKKKKPY